MREFLGDGVKIEPLVGDLVRIKGNVSLLSLSLDERFSFHYFDDFELILFFVGRDMR